MGIYTFQIDEGDNRYLLKVSSFTEQELANWGLDASLEMYEVVLLRVSGDVVSSFKSLAMIAGFLRNFMAEHPDAILYFYCDDMHEINKTNKHIDASPQLYRSKLFSTLFDRESQKQHNSTLRNNVQAITTTEGTAYIHLVTSEKNLHVVEHIHEQLENLSRK